MVYDTLAQCMKALGAVSVGESSRSEDPDQVKAERDFVLKEVNAYKMKKEKLEKMLIEKEVVT